VKSSERCLIEGVEAAQKIARERGLRLGATVCHPNDNHIYILHEVNGNTATVKTSMEHSPDEKVIAKEFPLDELFELSTAQKMVMRIASRHCLANFVGHAMNKNFQ